MKRYLLAVPLLLCVAHARADTPAAVAATNFQAGLTMGDTYVNGDRASNFYDVNGGAFFPIATYLGASLSGDYNHTNIATNPFPDTTPSSAWPSCTVRSENLNAGLFVRNPSIGRIGVGYGAGRQESQCSATFLATGNDRLNTRHATASAEYYFSRVTIGATRSRTRLDGGNDLDSNSLIGSWYPTNNVRIALAADGLDLEKTYHLNIEYQPEILDNSTSVTFGYMRQRQTYSTYAFSVGFSYFFGTDVDLLTRDRRYR